MESPREGVKEEVLELGTFDILCLTGATKMDNRVGAAFAIQYGGECWVESLPLGNHAIQFDYSGHYPGMYKAHILFV